MCIDKETIQNQAHTTQGSPSKKVCCGKCRATGYKASHASSDEAKKNKD